MLWIALYLPDLSLQIAARSEPQSVTKASRCPLVIQHGPTNRPLVFAANAAARAMGIETAMPVAGAQALVNDLLVLTRHPQQEDAALHNLALWAGQFTPHIVVQGKQGLRLEVESCLNMFKGLPQLLVTLRQGLRELGYSARLGIAPTGRGAWLLAKASAQQSGIRSCTQINELVERLWPLPLALFGWPVTTLSLLQQLGVTRVGHMIELPRAGVVQRFGLAVLNDLDHALGLLPDPQPCFVPPDTFAARIEFLQEVTQTEALLFVLKRMLLELGGFLRARGAGVQQFALILQHSGRDKLHTPMTIGLLAPERDAARLWLLARERIERDKLPRPVVALSLVADALLPYVPNNQSLLPTERRSALGWQQLQERLHARVGKDKVFILQPGNDHRPEWATVLIDPGKEGKVPRREHRTPRPMWLLPKPQPLSLTLGEPYYHGTLNLTAGPERLECGWWDSNGVGRDYFVAQNNPGETLWLYREHHNRHGWFLHGLFA